MFIQSDLQAVFDALFTVGAIDPVLKMDWDQVAKEAIKNQIQINEAFVALNSCLGDREMMVTKLNKIDQKVINYIAVEVAREFAEFTTRSSLH